MQGKTRAGAGRKQAKEQVRADGRTAAGRFAKGRSGNPAGGRRKAPTQADLTRLDAWISGSTGFGVPGVDKSLDYSFVFEPVSDLEAAELWAGNDIAKRIIELPADEMYREGLELKTEDSKVSTELMKRLKAVGAFDALKRAKKVERAMGGSAIMPILNDAQRDLRKPLNRARIKDLTNLMVLEPRELEVVSYYNQFGHPKYRRPEIYRLNPNTPGGVVSSSTMEIHESRLIIWRGIHVTDRPLGELIPGWGHSILTLVKGALGRFDLTWNAISVLICDFAQAVIKMKNLARLVSEGKIDEIKARMLAVEISRSVCRAIMIDAEEEYKRETTSVAGLPDLADRVASRLAASAGMPLTLVMGQSPKGLGNEGDSDLEWFYNLVGGMQEDDEPQVREVVELCALDLDGPTKGKIPEDLSIEWRALWQPDDKTTAEARKSQMEADKGYVEMEVLTRDDVAQSRFGGDKYSFETTIDWEAREAETASLSRALEEQEVEEAAAAAAAQAGNPAPAPASPDMPAANGLAGPGGSVQQTAFNGAQVAAMLDVVERVGLKKIPRESGVAILSIAFPITKAQATEVLGPETFKPEPDVPAAPFGGGPAGAPAVPAKPAAKPPAAKPAPDEEPIEEPAPAEGED